MKIEPFEYLMSFGKEKFPKDKENLEYISTLTDSFVTWLVGFSFGGLSLLAANFDKIIDEKIHANPKPVIVLFFLSILFGVICRYVSFLMNLKQRQLDNLFYGRFGNQELYVIDQDKDSANWSFDEVVMHLKDDFEEKLDFKVRIFIGSN